MKRFSNLIGRSKNNSSQTSPLDTIPAGAGTPEGTAIQAIRIFCESGSTSNHDEEVLQLPTIVDGAESSPAAAAACAVQVRSFLDLRKYEKTPHVHYNAIMLTRILSDHPGASFTRNFDDKFVRAVKTLLREGRDASVQQILRETLDVIEATRTGDAGVQGLVTMWRREKGKQASFEQRYPRSYPQGATVPGGVGMAAPSQNGSGRLPPPSELSSRIEESRNTAKILIQFLQTTPSEELAGNELIREFAERCESAQRSMQGYINCQNPVPDDDTLQTLIETNEQLSLASSRYQRAVLAARRAMGGSSPGETSRAGSIPAAAPQLPPPVQQETSLFAPVPRSVQNGFGTFGTTNGSYGFGNNTSIIPPTLPPKHQPQMSTDSRVSAPRDDDEDELYDSPIAVRAPPAADPFADPEPLAKGYVAQTEASSTYSSQAPTPAPTLTSPTAARPTPAPWHNSTVTESFLGRQSTAAGGLTMSPPPGVESRAELDGHSQVGRT